MVIFIIFRVLEGNRLSERDAAEDFGTNGSIICGGSFLLVSCLAAVSIITKALLDNDVFGEQLSQSYLKNTLQLVMRDVLFILVTLNMTITCIFFVIRNNNFRQTLFSIFSPAVDENARNDQEPVRGRNKGRKIQKREQEDLNDARNIFQVMARKIIQARYGCNEHMNSGETNKKTSAVYRVTWTKGDTANVEIVKIPKDETRIQEANIATGLVKEAYLTEDQIMLFAWSLRKPSVPENENE